MKKILYLTYTILSIALIPLIGVGQEIERTEWIFENEGDNREDEITGVVTDSEGNVYITGWFSGTINLDPEGSAAGEITSFNNTIDGYLAKYNSEGEFLDSRSLDINELEDVASGIALSNDETQIYVVGHFQWTEGDYEMFVHSFSTENLNFLHGHNSSSSGYETGQDVAVHSNGDVYVTGYFEEGFFLLPADIEASDGLFLAVLDGDDLTMVKNVNTATGTARVRCGGIDVDGSGDAYIVGEFDNTLTFPGEGSRTSNGGSDIFFAKYDVSDEDFEMVTQVGGSSDDRARSIALSSNSLYITGDFRGTTNFNPDGGGASNLTAGSQYDFFVARYSLTGSYQNVYRVGGSGSRSFEQGNDVFYRDNKVYVTGRVTVTSRVQGDNRFFQGGGENNESDAFLAIFNNNLNNVEYVNRFGTSDLDFGESVTASTDGVVYVGGFANWARQGGDLRDEIKNSYLVKFAEEDEVVPVVEYTVSDKLSAQLLESVSLGGRDVNLANFDSDNDLDLAVAFKTGNELRRYRNNNGTFGEGDVLDNSLEDYQTLSSADLDQDGDTDIVVANYDGDGSKLGWLRNNNGNFGNFQEISDEFAGSSDVFAGDIDLDGDPDIILTNFESRDIVYFENDGGEFDDEEVIDETVGGPRVVQVANLNNDVNGFPDLVVVLRDDNETTADEDVVLFYAGQGNGEFANPIEIADGNDIDNPRGAAIADFDGDNNLDIVVVSYDGGNVTIIPNNGNGTFASPRSVGTVSNPFSIDATDLDGDGDIDILVGSENAGSSSEDGVLVWFKNNGDAVFSTENLVTVPKAQPTAIATDDIDNDGDQDIVVAFGENGKFDLVSANVLLSLTNNIQNTPRPLILERSANQGDPNDFVQLYGGNYGSIIGTARVFFGGNEAVVEEVSAEGTQLLVQIPNVASGVYEIIVRLPNGQEAASTNFTIGEIVEPSLDEVSPVNDVAVGTEVIIQGAGFGNNPTVKIGEATAVVNSVNPEGTTISVTVPDLPVGDYLVTVTPAGGTELISDERISVIVPVDPLPEVDDITPEQGIVGTSVTITGSLLDGVTVEFGGTEVLPDAQSATSITFTVPSGFVSGQSYTVNVVDGERIVPGGAFRVLPDGEDPDITDPSIRIVSLSSTTYIPGSDITVEVEIRDEEGGSGVNESSVQLVYQELFSSGSSQSKMMTLLSEDTYETTLSDSELADVFSNNRANMAIFARGADQAGNMAETDVRTINREFTSLRLEGVSEIVNSEAPAQTDYQMIGIPLQSQSVTSQFEELGDFLSDNTGDWALYRYNSSSNTYQQLQNSGFSNFEPGVGYMFAYRNFEGSIELDGQTVNLTDNTFPIVINSGFTLISNPYLSAIDWADVVEYNESQGNINQGAIDTELLKWKHGQGWDSGETSLRQFEGAFVQATGVTGSVTLEVPLLATARLDARVSKDPFSQDLSSSTWYIPFELKSDNHSTYDLGGVGMHPKAKIAEDRFDALTPPRFIEYLDMSFPARGNLNLSLTKDIVPTQNSFMWEFEIAASGNSPVTLTWDNSQFGNSDYQLVLLDLESLVKTNLSQEASYRFVANQSHKFQLFYGTSQDIAEEMIPNQFSVGTPYPNPTSSTLSIPVSIPESNRNEHVRLIIYDITGQQVADQTYALSEGYQNMMWSGTGADNKAVPPGLYIYQVQQNLGQSFSGKFVVR